MRLPSAVPGTATAARAARSRAWCTAPASGRDTRLSRTAAMSCRRAFSTRHSSNLADLPVCSAGSTVIGPMPATAPSRHGVAADDAAADFGDDGVDVGAGDVARATASRSPYRGNWVEAVPLGDRAERGVADCAGGGGVLRASGSDQQVHRIPRFGAARAAVIRGIFPGATADGVRPDGPVHGPRDGPCVDQVVDRVVRRRAARGVHCGRRRCTTKAAACAREVTSSL